MKALNYFRSSLPLAVLAVLGAASPAQAQSADKITYQDHVLPIFRNACNGCHNPDKKKAGLDLTSYQAALAGSDNGAVLNSGDPNGSLLYRTMTHAEEPTMPPKRDKLPQTELDLVKKWIAGGLLETATGKAAAPTKPKVDLGTVVVSGKPTGPIAFPKELVTEPVVSTTRAGAVESLASSPWAPVIAVGGQKQVILYHAKTLEVVGVVPFDEGVPRVVKFSRNGSVMLVAGGQGAKIGKAVLYDVTTGNRLTEVGDEVDEVLAADISPDQKIVAIGGPGRVTKGYDVAEGKELYVCKKHTDWVTAVAISPNGEYLATGDRAGNLFVWEAKDGGELYTLNGHKDAIASLEFRGDSAVLMSASKDGSIRLWEMAEGKQIKTWDAHTRGVSSAGYTHDGRIVSAGRDKAVKTWDVSGAAAKTLAPAFNDIAMNVTFDSEGQRVFAGDWTGVVRVWDAADGKLVGELSPNPPRLADRLAAAIKRAGDAEPAAAKAEQELKALADAAQQAANAEKQANEKLAALKQSITELQQKQTKLEGEATSLPANVRKANAESEQKRQVLEQANRALSVAEQAVKNAAAQPAPAVDLKPLTEELATKKAAVEEAKARVAAAEKAAKENAKDEAAKAAVSEAKASLERRTVRLAEAQKALADAKNAKPVAAIDPAVAKRVEEAKAAVAKAKGDHEAAQKAAADAKTAADNAVAELAATRQANLKAKADLTALEPQLKPLNMASKAAAEKAGIAQKALDDARAAIVVAKVDVAKLKAQQAGTTLHRERKTLTAAEQAKANADQAAKDAAAAIEKAQADIAAFKKARVESPEKVKALAAKLEPVRKQLADATAPAETAAKTVVDREAIAEKSAELVRLLTEQVNKSPDNKALAEASLTAKKSLEIISGDLAAAKENAAKLAAARTAIEKQMVALEQEIAKEKSDTANASQILAGLNKTLADAQSDLPKKQAAAKEAEKPIAEAKKKVDEAKAEYDRLAAEVTKLQPVSKG